MAAPVSREGKEIEIGSPIERVEPEADLVTFPGPHNRPSTRPEYGNVLIKHSQSEEAMPKLSMEEFDMVSDEGGKGDAWAESATMRAQMGICRVCGGYVPSPSGKISLPTPESQLIEATFQGLKRAVAWEPKNW